MRLQILHVPDCPGAEALNGILGPLLVYIGGYGPLLCAVTIAAYLREFQHAEMRWDKTEKTGKVAAPA